MGQRQVPRSMSPAPQPNPMQMGQQQAPVRSMPQEASSGMSTQGPESLEPSYQRLPMPQAPQGHQFQASMDQLMQQGPQTFQSGQPGSANSFDNAILQSQGQMGEQMPMNFQPGSSAFSYEDADPRQAARGQRYMGDMRQR